MKWNSICLALLALCLPALAAQTGEGAVLATPGRVDQAAGAGHAAEVDEPPPADDAARSDDAVQSGPVPADALVQARPEDDAEDPDAPGGEAAPVAPPPALAVVLGRPWPPAGEQQGLRLVTRGHTGAATTAKVFGGLLGALAGGTQVTAFSKEQLKGKRIGTVPDPTGPLVLPAMEQRIGAMLASRPVDAPPAPPLRIEATPGDWTLIYRKLKQSDTPYDLRYRARVRVLDAGDGAAGAVAVLECNPEPRAMSLDAWRDEDYAQVHAVAADYARQCADQVAGQLEPWLAARDAPAEPGATTLVAAVEADPGATAVQDAAAGPDAAAARP